MEGSHYQVGTKSMTGKIRLDQCRIESSGKMDEYMEGFSQEGWQRRL